MMPFLKGRLFWRLSRWDDMIAHQQWVVSQYHDRLCDAGLAAYEADVHVEPVYYKYPMLFEPRRKEVIMRKARSAGVELSDMFGSPVYPVERAAQWKALGYQKGLCPISEDVSARIVALPVHRHVEREQIEKTVDLLRSS